MDEPYRLFTSRAEFRLLLRQDNAVERLGPVAQAAGLLTTEQEEQLAARTKAREKIRSWFVNQTLTPGEANVHLETVGSSRIGEPVRAAELLRRPEVGAGGLLEVGGVSDLADGAEGVELLGSVEMEIKYSGYVQRERERAERLRGQEEFRISGDAPFGSFATLSVEAREKLSRIRPQTLGQAGRIPGVSPADLQNLILEIKRWRRRSGVREEEAGVP